MSSVYLKPANIAKFAVLPGIFPRLKHLFGGFNYIPFLMAQVFGLFGLLPPAHPYLQNANIGRYGIAKLMAVSAQSFEWNRNNTDKIVLYLTAVIGMAIIALMGIAGVLYLSALPVWASSLFITPNPNTDIAFHILNRVIGVPGIYGNALAAPDPFHSGIHAMLRMYSSALFAFAFVYLIYYIFSIIGETAITGTPFGKRFHKVYGPFRLITAIGLLMPFGTYGLNSAQYIILYAAKYGSGLATNAWIEFNQVSAQPFGYGTSYTADFPQYVELDESLNPTLHSPGQYSSRGLMAVPRVPDAGALGSMINVIQTCQLLYKAYKPQMDGKDTDIKPYMIKPNPNTAVEFLGKSFDEAEDFYKNSDIVVYFGQQNDAYTNTGHVNPVCGSISIPITRAKYTGIRELREVYYNLIQTAFTQANTPLYRAGRGFAEHIVAVNATDQETYPYGSCASNSPTVGQFPKPAGADYPVSGECDKEVNVNNHIAYFKSQLNAEIARNMYPAIAKVIQKQELFEIPDEVYDYGWGGAGIWFNRISELNSDVFQSLHKLPQLNETPPLLEQALGGGSTIAQGLTMLTSMFGDPTQVRERRNSDPRDSQMSDILMRTYNYWASEETNNRPSTNGTDNAFIQAIAYVFGASPILTIRDDTGVHPFAQLTAIGKGLIEKAITALTLAGGLSFGEGMISSIPDSKYHALAGFFKGKAGLLKAIAFTGLTAGFIMYYIIPFMPFLYFFFAVSGWVKSIFEALVGAPLWALAHMRLEGESFLSKQSLSGYYMTLEIFIRPILILFGLLASSSLFASLVLVLNMMFDLV
ncbi:MAG: DotA/TraY family protein, partial [Pseudobdellovibrionaceae bacterium]